MNIYAERFWKKNWDEGLEDLQAEEYGTTNVTMINQTFKKAANETALS